MRKNQTKNQEKHKIQFLQTQKEKKENKRERENTHARPEWSNKTLKPHAADTKI